MTLFQSCSDSPKLLRICSGKVVVIPSVLLEEKLLPFHQNWRSTFFFFFFWKRDWIISMGLKAQKVLLNIFNCRFLPSFATFPMHQLFRGKWVEPMKVLLFSLYFWIWRDSETWKSCILSICRQYTPVIVENVKVNKALWNSEWFYLNSPRSSCHIAKCIIDCRTGEPVGRFQQNRGITQREFWRGYGDLLARRKDKQNRPMLLKVNVSLHSYASCYGWLCPSMLVLRNHSNFHKG